MDEFMIKAIQDINDKCVMLNQVNQEIGLSIAKLLLSIQRAEAESWLQWETELVDEIKSVIHLCEQAQTLTIKDNREFHFINSEVTKFVTLIRQVQMNRQS